MIREARIEDQHVVVLMIHAAIDDLVNIFTGSWDIKEALAQMVVLYNTPETRFSKEYCDIIEEDGVVAGIVVSYPAEEMYRLNAGMVRVMADHFQGTPDELELLQHQIMASQEAFDDEYYIDSLAVLEAFRGQGKSRKLIEHAEAKGKAAGYSKVSLLAEADNDKAYAIYQKLGYVHDCDLQVLGHMFRHLVKAI
ncbi:MAG: GNAT family N-acetyltransferase [Clostridia bacterium]|nr:GNAT family N-acetyltransferase [Clostridia bacterium]